MPQRPQRHTLMIVSAAVVLLAGLASADEVRTLAGKKLVGTVSAITDKEVVIKTDAGEVKTPLNEILAIELSPAKGSDGSRFTEVRLLDESVLRCQAVQFKGNQLELTLFSGQRVEIPLGAVVTLLNEAQDRTLRKEWDAIVADKVKRDRLVLLKNNALNPLSGTFGDVNTKQQTIQFRFEELNVTRDWPLAKAHGMIFYRTEELKDNPACFVLDTVGNSLAAKKVEVKNGTYTITTVGGVVLKYERPQLARLDYNLGKLKYLSDIEPVRVVERSGAGLIVVHRKDTNLDGEPIFLDRAYAKGLSLHAHTELEYDLNGKYKEFYAVLGVDPRVGAESQATVTIEYDGKKVFSEVITAKAVRVLPEDVRDVRGVRRLRIIVSSSNLLDLHDHVTLADAKISQ
jgi:preprotein translocase subunit YajC